MPVSISAELSQVFFSKFFFFFFLQGPQCLSLLAQSFPKSSVATATSIYTSGMCIGAALASMIFFFLIIHLTSIYTSGVYIGSALASVSILQVYIYVYIYLYICAQAMGSWPPPPHGMGSHCLMGWEYKYLTKINAFHTHPKHMHAYACICIHTCICISYPH